MGCPSFSTPVRGQFTSEALTSVLIANKIAISMDGKGAWRDNVFVERIWKSIKYEEVYPHAYDSVVMARASIARYLNFIMGDVPARALTAARQTRLISKRHLSWRLPEFFAAGFWMRLRSG